MSAATAFTPPSKVKLPVSALLTLASAVAMSASSLAIAKMKLDDMGDRVSAIEAARAADRELLVRIDERTAEIKRIIDSRRITTP
jgi:hypothetical protein